MSLLVPSTEHLEFKAAFLAVQQVLVAAAHMISDSVADTLKKLTHKVQATVVDTELSHTDSLTAVNRTEPSLSAEDSLTEPVASVVQSLTLHLRESLTNPFKVRSRERLAAKLTDGETDANG